MAGVAESRRTGIRSNLSNLRMEVSSPWYARPGTYRSARSFILSASVSLSSTGAAVVATGSASGWMTSNFFAVFRHDEARRMA